MINRVVYKYTLPQGPAPAWQPVTLPAGAQIVRVGQQDDVPVVWAIVDPDQDAVEAVRLIAVPTGYVLDVHAMYLGSTELHGVAIVVHVFQELPKIPGPPLAGPVDIGGLS